MPRLITLNWRNCNAWVADFGHTFLQLRGAYDMRGSVEQHYLRSLDHPIASTVGLLSLLGCRVLTARPVTVRPSCLSLFNAFIKDYIGADDYEILLTLHAPYPCALNCTPADGEIQLPVDAGVVSFSALLGKAGVFETKFDDALTRVGAIGDIGKTSASLGTFLVAVIGAGVPEVVSQVVTQVAAIIDSVVAEKRVANPLDIEETVPSIGGRCRPDRVVMDHLLLGGGKSGTKPAEMSSAHIKSWQTLTEEGKRCKTLDPPTMNSNLLLRLHHTVEVSLSKR